MATWTDADIYRLDLELAKKGVAQHARAHHVAMHILGPEYVIGVGGNPKVVEILADYARLFPGAEKSWPGMGVGLVASVDQVRRVTVPVVFGSCNVSVYEGLGFDSHAQFASWCRQDQDIALKAAFSFADIFDLTYALDEARSSSLDAIEAWTLAMSHLEVTTNGLVGGFDLAALTQSICMTAELSIKAALMHLGVEQKKLKQLGHDNAASAKFLASLKPHRDDVVIGQVAAKLPPYVGSRYKRSNLTRLEMVDLALTSQFIASSTLRRFTDRDLAAMIENEEGPDARRRFFG